MKILIIEDDQETVETIALALNIRWPEAELISANQGKKGLEMVETKAPDIVILDLGLPDKNGFEILKEIRTFSQVPIIISTVRSEESDVVRGLELGADDYLVKPFGKLELLARIHALTRRQRVLIGNEAIVCGPLRFGASMSKLQYKDKEIRLSKTEGLILYNLMKNAGQVLNYVTLAEIVWGDYYNGADTNLRVFIHHLREKIEEDPYHPKLILTKVGVGYYMQQPG